MNTQFTIPALYAIPLTGNQRKRAADRHANNSKPDNAMKRIKNVSESTLIHSKAAFYAPIIYDKPVPVPSCPDRIILDLYDRPVSVPSCPERIIPGLYDRLIPVPSCPVSSNPDLFSKQILDASDQGVGPLVTHEEEAEGPAEEVEGAEGPTEELEGPEGPEGAAEEAEGPAVLNNVNLNNSSNHSNNLSIVYKYAKHYTTKADAGIRIAKTTTRAIGHFVNAFSVTTAEAWNLGGKEFAKKIVKESVGIKHYREARNTLKNSWAGQIPSRLDVNEKMGVVEALGEAASHCCIGVTRAATTVTALTGAGLYTLGTASNALGYIPASNMSLHMAARVLATGVNRAGNIMLSVASHTVVPAVKSIATTVVRNPAMAASYAAATTRLGVTAAGMATGLYYASSNFTRAVDAPNLSSKIKHGTLAAASLVATVTVPYFMYA